MRRLAPILALVFTGCLGDLPATPPDNDVILVGQYTLRTYKGLPLPVTISSAGAAQKVEIIADVYGFDVAAHYVKSGTTRTTTGDIVATTPAADVGTYTAASGILSFTSNYGLGTFPAVLKGDTITVTRSDGVAVYVKI